MTEFNLSDFIMEVDFEAPDHNYPEKGLMINFVNVKEFIRLLKKNWSIEKPHSEFKEFVDKLAGNEFK